MPRRERTLEADAPFAAFSARLRQLRAEARLTYQELAERTGYSTTALSTAAAGHSLPSWDKVEAFVTACGVTDRAELARWRSLHGEAQSTADRGSRDDADGSEPMDPTVVSTRGQLAAALRGKLHESGLSYRQLAEITGDQLAPSTISDLVSGKVLPDDVTVVAFLNACAPGTYTEPWLDALQRVRDASGRDPIESRPDRQPEDGPDRSERGPAGRTPDHLDVRALARTGILAQVARTLAPADLRSLRADAYRVITPVVFQNHTRRLETARRHFHCAQSFQSLKPECLDHFHDDLEAVIEDLFRHATVPIVNLEGWVTRRLQAATVDGYRRRRGEVGALQRPRLPGWLIAELDGEPRLQTLALLMLEWVGVEQTAGASVWPLGLWADRRAWETGDHRGAYRAVVDDVETVLAAMRRRPAWYESFVERPLGRKRAPVAIQANPDAGTSEPMAMMLTAHDELIEARIRELARAAVEAIERRVGRGQEAHRAVVEVLTIAFTGGSGAEDLDQPPGSSTDLSEVVAWRLASPETLDRIVATVMEVLSQDTAP